MKNIFAGNLDFNTTEEQLRARPTVRGVTILDNRDALDRNLAVLAFVELEKAEQAKAGTIAAIKS